MPDLQTVALHPPVSRAKSYSKALTKRGAFPYSSAKPLVRRGPRGSRNGLATDILTRPADRQMSRGPQHGLDSRTVFLLHL